MLSDVAVRRIPRGERGPQAERRREPCKKQSPQEEQDRYLYEVRPVGGDAPNISCRTKPASGDDP